MVRLESDMGRTATPAGLGTVDLSVVQEMFCRSTNLLTRWTFGLSARFLWRFVRDFGFCTKNGQKKPPHPVFTRAVYVPQP